MENHFNRNRWPPLNVTIFITHMRNCVMEATSMFVSLSESLSLLTVKMSWYDWKIVDFDVIHL